MPPHSQVCSYPYLLKFMGYKFMITSLFPLEFPPSPSPPPPTPSSFGQAGQLPGKLSTTARVPIFVLWAVLRPVDRTWKMAVHQISKENAIPLSPKFVFLFACTYLYSDVSLYPSVVITRIRTCRNVNLQPVLSLWRNACRRSCHLQAAVEQNTLYTL